MHIVNTHRIFEKKSLEIVNSREKLHCAVFVSILYSVQQLTDMDESFLAPAQSELAVYARIYCACSRCLWRLFGQFSLPYRLFSFSVCLRDGLIKSKNTVSKGRLTKTTNQTTSPFKMAEYSIMVFLHFYKGKQLLWLFVCFPEKQSHSKCTSTLKGKNLLLGKQILSFNSRSLREGGQNGTDRVASPENIPMHI